MDIETVIDVGSEIVELSSNTGDSVSFTLCPWKKGMKPFPISNELNSEAE